MLWPMMLSSRIVPSAIYSEYKRIVSFIMEWSFLIITRWERIFHVGGITGNRLENARLKLKADKIPGNDYNKKRALEKESMKWQINSA